MEFNNLFTSNYSIISSHFFQRILLILDFQGKIDDQALLKVLNMNLCHPNLQNVIGRFLNQIDTHLHFSQTMEHQFKFDEHLQFYLFQS